MKLRSRVRLCRNTVTLLMVMLLCLCSSTACADSVPVTNGLLLSLQADTGVTTSGGKVTLWEDQASTLGGTNNATPAGGSGTEPTLIVNGLNGESTVNFNGSTQFLQIAGNATFDTATFTWIIVTQYFRNTASTQTLLNSAYSSGAGTSSDEIWGTKSGKGDPFAYSHRASGSTIASGGLGSDSPMILSAVWGDDDTLTHWLNGKKNSTQSNVDANPSGHLSTEIGKPADISSSFFSGNISEILVYDRALSASERQQVEAFLGDKYGIAVVPEPSAIVLLVAGGALVGFRQRKGRC